MLNTLSNQSMWSSRRSRLKGVLAAALFAVTGAATAADVTVNLCATSGIAAPPIVDPITVGGVKVYGYVSSACSAAAAVSAPGGPVIAVNQGDVVTVNLENALPTASGLLFQGQALVPDATGAPAATVSAFGTKSYTFTASAPGTYLYEAAPLPNAQHQVAMGLYGALVVRPATAGQAYADPLTAYAHEATLVLSELDPALNNSTDPAAFDMRTYAPKYFLINGKPYPMTDLIPSASGEVIGVGKKVLLRYVNAGAKHHSMAVLGLRQNFVAKDGGVLPTLNHNVVAETLAPGQTGDAIVTIPATLATESRFAVYDASLSLHNNGADNAFGGMLTFVKAGAGAATTGPTTSAVAIAPNPTSGTTAVTLSATIAPVNPSTPVTGVEYFIDATGTGGTGTAMTGTTAATAAISATTLAGLTSGNHTFFVHGYDGTTWGAFSSATLNLDKTGPATTGLVVSPNPSNGSVAVALSATANDSASGGSNVVAAEYWIDSGTPVAMTLGGAAAPVRSLTATISAATMGGLTAGTHTVYVRSQDALGNWTAVPAQVALTKASNGPTTSNVSASPNPANGVQGSSSSSTAVRVSALMTSATVNVAAAEAFIDCSACALPGATGVGTFAGTGIQFVAGDGAFNSGSEAGYGDIPLSTVALLTAGPHTIYVHGKDAAGNWGGFATTVLVVNQSAPTVTNIVLTPAITNNSPVAISASATDVATGNQNIAAGEYFIDTVGAAGTGAVMQAGGTASPTRTLTATIPSSVVGSLPVGNHTVYVRARDQAGNWSATFGAALMIDRTPPTFVSIVRNGTSPTNAASVSYTVTFSEPVTGINNNDFTAVDNVSPGSPSISSISGAGATRVVTISTGNNGATGTVGLNLNRNASITDLAGNALATVPSSDTSRTGPLYTIDKSAPTLSSVTLAPNSITSGTASVALTVNGAVDNGTGVVGGEWWIGNNNIPAGTGSAFPAANGTTGGITIPTGTLAAGRYTVRVRLLDAVGNWGSGNTGLRTATLTVR